MPANYGQPRGEWRFRTFLRRNVPVTCKECNCKRRAELLQQFLSENAPVKRTSNKKVKATYSLNCGLRLDPAGLERYIEQVEAIALEYGRV
jgi:hypothetical protein